MRIPEVYLANKSLLKNRYYGGITLSLPATESAIADAKYRAQIQTGSEYIVDCDSGWPEFLEQIINDMDDLSLEEVNLLAYQISRMDQFQIETLAGAVQLRQEEDIVTPVTMKELINLAHNLGCYEYRPGVVDDRTLGNVALENDLLDTISGLPEDVLDLLDEEKVGQEMRRSDMGTYTEAGYIFPNRMPHQEWYDGIHLPDIPDMPKGVIAVLLSSLDKPDEAGIWLELPATEQEMQSVLKQLGEHSFDNCLIAGSISTAFPYPLAGDEDVEKLNALAQKIQAFPDQRTAELPDKKINVEIKSLNSKAMDLSARIAPAYREKEMEIRNEIDFALDVAENLDCYDFDPKMYSPAAYAEYIFREAGIDPNDPAFAMFDFMGYGERQMQQAGHIQTAYGMILRNENSFVSKYSQTESMQMGGM